jgi:iron complex outermembrane receptor protein
VRALTRAAFFAGALLPASGVQGQDEKPAVRLDSVVVTVTRTTGRSILRSPFAVSIVDPDSARPGQRHTAVDETLSAIPGVSAISRNNPSQDPRLSIRGFGARSAFGVRGIKVLRDGMPLTLPDGQTPLDYLSLESVGRIEVMRGAASALYGNASGGVIDIRSAAPSATALSLDAKQSIGPNDFYRSALAATGSSSRSHYVADAAYTKSSGERRHSRQRALTGFVRAGTTIGKTDLSLTGLGLDNPLAENPGALTAEEMRANTSTADALSIRRNARKAVKQVQVGMSLFRHLPNGDISISGFGGARSLDNPLTFAIVEIGRHTYGGSVMLRQSALFSGLEHRFAAGIDVQTQNDLRRNFATCADTVPLLSPTVSCPDIKSERGVVTLDQRELVSSAGAYISDELRIGKSIGISAGVRADRIVFNVRDRLVTVTNPDDSGRRPLGAISPIAGVVWSFGDTHSAYGNLSAAFETPTATELGNHEDGSAGLNPDLDPQRSRTMEAGLKGFLGSLLHYDAAIYRTRVSDELVPFEIPNSNGRRFFRNAGRTTRTGAELGAEIESTFIGVVSAYTYSRFRYDDFTVGTTSYDGNFIPGIPRHRIQSALRLGNSRAFGVVENETAGHSFADDANSVTASPYSVSHVRIGFAPLSGERRFSLTAGVYNIFDRVYASSIAVNAARSKFYEPASRRMLVVTASVGAQTGGSSIPR